MDVTCHHDDLPKQEIAGFLAQFPNQGGLEHDPRWLTVLGDAMGHETWALIARRAGAGSPITGYLPLALLSSRLFGRFLVSLPYLNRAGVISTDTDSRDALIEQSVTLANQLNVQYLELRHDDQVVEHSHITRNHDEKVVMTLDLPDAESLWDSLPSKVRNLIRKAQRSDLKITFGGLEHVEDFYSIFAVNMRDLGTPVYPRNLFTQILTQFPDEAELGIVTHEGFPIAGALLLHDHTGEQTITQVPSASCLRPFNAINANMWMYHQLIQRAIARGSTCFDFGRTTPGSGTHRFKKQWKAQPRPTTWQYHIRHGQPDAMRPNHPSMQRKIEVWKKLPVWVTRLVGPTLVRGIP